MKSTVVKMSAFVLALAASAGSFAATQGTAGATSTGTFTNTIGAVAPPQVRVFGLIDSNITATSAPVANPFGGTSAGVVNDFCVAHSAGGNVRLTLSSNGITNATLDQDLAAVSASTGNVERYHQYLVRPGTTPEVANLIKNSAATYDVSNAQNDLVNCVSPNVSKGIILTGWRTWNPVATDIFTDVVTVVASPL